MRARRNGRSIGIAFAAMLALVLHALVSVVSTGHAAAPVLDAFGNVLCAPGFDAGPGGDGPALPPCCALGCAAVAPSLPAPPDLVFLTVEPAELPRPVPPRIGPHRPAAPDHDPASPRAPPLPA